MATKQTLKSLLGGSDSRKQVSLDLGTPVLQPTVQRAGQYSVAVQATPKTNSAMQLAQALRVTPQVLGQANNIAMDMGAKAAATTMDVEGALDDTERKGILGYDKAYQQGLIKRHFVMNEEVIKERFLNLSRTDDSMQMTPDQFVERIEGERQEFVSELIGQFGDNSNRVDAIAALTGSFVDNLRDEATSAWVDNKKDQAFMQLSADTSDIIKKKGATAGLKHAQAEINAWALDLKQSEKATKLRGIIIADAAVLMEQGKISQAEALLDEASTYNLHGNAKLFGSAEGKMEITELRKTIRKARETNEVSFSDNSKGLGRSVDASLQDVADPDVSIEDRQASNLRLAKRAGVPDDAAQAFAEAASTGGVDAFIEAYRDLTRNTDNENTRDLLNDQLGEINKAKKDYFGGNASTIGTFTPEDLATLEVDIRAALDLKPNTVRTQLPNSVNGRRMNTNDPDYIDLMKTVNADYEWATVKSQKSAIIVNTQKAIRGTASEDSGFGDYADEYAVAILSDLDEKAPLLYNQAKGDVAVYDGLLQEEAAKLKGQYFRRAQLRSSTETILDTSLSSSMKNDAEEEAYKNPEGATVKERKPRKTVRDLVSFSTDGDVSIKDVIADRATINGLDIKVTDKRRLLQVSLMERGFPTMESFDLKLLSNANMGFEDILLGEPVRRAMGAAQLGYQAQKLLKESGGTLNPESVSDLEALLKESEGAMEKWMDYGFDSLEDFIKIEEGQATLRALNNR